MFGQLALKPADLVAKSDQLIEDVGRLPWTATLNEIDQPPLSPLSDLLSEALKEATQKANC